ncbi:MAG: hypothetical protein H8E32_14780 [Nitrospinae bacterium]|nr:hypothetical protein [Nitrospinota bacterium]
MVKVLERAVEELSALPSEDQEKLGHAILGVLHAPVPYPTDEETEEWDKLTSSPESQRFLDHMIQKVDDSIEKGEIYPDPADVVKFDK